MDATYIGDHSYGGAHYDWYETIEGASEYGERGGILYDTGAEVQYRIGNEK